MIRLTSLRASCWQSVRKSSVSQFRQLRWFVPGVLGASSVRPVPLTWLSRGSSPVPVIVTSSTSAGRLTHALITNSQPVSSPPPYSSMISRAVCPLRSRDAINSTVVAATVHPACVYASSAECSLVVLSVLSSSPHPFNAASANSATTSTSRIRPRGLLAASTRPIVPGLFPASQPMYSRRYASRDPPLHTDPAVSSRRTTTLPGDGTKGEHPLPQALLEVPA